MKETPYLLKAWEYCQALDEKDYAGLKIRLDLKEVFTLDYKHDYGIAAIDKDDNLILAFQGSDDLKDWINNLRFVKVGPKNVHAGFAATWVGFAEQVSKILEGRCPNDITVIGHSRGSAIASLCAYDIAFYNKSEVNLITFGSPRVGGRDFRNEFKKLPISGVNVIAGNDFVSNLPPLAAGFRDCYENYRIGGWRRWIPSFISGIYWHNHYKKALTKYYKKRGEI